MPPHLRRRPGRNGARFSRERTLVSLQFSRWLKRRTIRIFRQEAPWWRWTELCNRRRPRDFREHQPKSRLLRTPQRNPPMKSCPRGALALQRSKRCELRKQFRRRCIVNGRKIDRVGGRNRPTGASPEIFANPGRRPSPRVRPTSPSMLQVEKSGLAQSMLRANN